MTGLAFLCVGFLVGWFTSELRTAWRDVSDPFDVHADDALDVARPLGPEDSDDWGSR